MKLNNALLHAATPDSQVYLVNDDNPLPGTQTNLLLLFEE